MKFISTVHGEQYLIDAHAVGAYTMVIIQRSNTGTADQTTFQLFPLRYGAGGAPSSEAFLERAARIAMRDFATRERALERVNMIAYDDNSPIFAGELHLA